MGNDTARFADMMVGAVKGYVGGVALTLSKRIDELEKRRADTEIQTRLGACESRVGALSMLLSKSLPGHTDIANIAELILRVKALEQRGPGVRYRGVFKDGESYEPGDLATHSGALFYCWRSTSANPGTASDWQMMHKTHGKDGR